MTEYNFFQDLFDTYQSMSIFMQLAWLVVPFLSAVTVLALLLHHTRKVHGTIKAFPSEETQIYKMMNEDLKARILESREADLVDRKQIS